MTVSENVIGKRVLEGIQVLRSFCSQIQVQIQAQQRQAVEEQEVVERGRGGLEWWSHLRTAPSSGGEDTPGCPAGSVRTWRSRQRSACPAYSSASSSPPHTPPCSYTRLRGWRDGGTGGGDGGDGGRDWREGEERKERWVGRKMERGRNRENKRERERKREREHEGVSHKNTWILLLCCSRLHSDVSLGRGPIFRSHLCWS